MSLTRDIFFDLPFEDLLLLDDRLCVSLLSSGSDVYTLEALRLYLNSSLLLNRCSDEEDEPDEEAFDLEVTISEWLRPTNDGLDGDLGT